MSKKHRNKMSKAERRQLLNQDHPGEEAENKNYCDVPNHEDQAWRPVEGVEDFIKNIKRTKTPVSKNCRVIMPDNEPWNRKKNDNRYIGGSYPPIEMDYTDTGWPMN